MSDRDDWTVEHKKVQDKRNEYNYEYTGKTKNESDDNYSILINKIDRVGESLTRDLEKLKDMLDELEEEC